MILANEYVVEQIINNTFSPPDKLEIFRQLFLGGITLKIIPLENGSMLSMSSS